MVMLTCLKLLSCITNGIGGWEQDKRVGYGRYYYYNGDIYDGTWQNHVRHGHGTYTYGDSGAQWTGTWNNGIRVVDRAGDVETFLRVFLVFPS